jgi:hypothetical protein
VCNVPSLPRKRLLVSLASAAAQVDCDISPERRAMGASRRRVVIPARATRGAIRAVALVTSIVAAFQVHLVAAGPVSQDVPLPGGTEAFARAAGIAPAPERARFVAELARLLHQSAEPHKPRTKRAAPVLPAIDGISTAVEAVPIPLTVDVWSQAVFRRPVAPNAIVGAILADSRAAHLCYGLAALDDETLRFFADHPDDLSALYESGAALFAAFGGNLHVSGNRILAPGGPIASAMWETVIGEKLDRPERFIRALFRRGDGRLAYLYDTVAELDAPHAAFALNLWMNDPGMRVSRFKEFAAVVRGAFPQWQPGKLPFSRPVHDIASMLARVGVESNGSPSFPAQRAAWAWVFDAHDAPSDVPNLTRANDDPIDAAWLARHVASAELRQRGEQLDQLAFARRVFALAATSEAGGSELLTAIRAFPHCRMLMLALERMGVRQASVYAAAARRAQQLSALPDRRRFVALAHFQGALVLVLRMATVQTLDQASAEALVTSLVSVPLVGEGRYAGGIARWIQQELQPAIVRNGGSSPSDAAAAPVFLRALSGAPMTGANGRIAWEGQVYRLDLAAAEEQRLQSVREKQGSPALEASLDLASVARQLAETTLSPTVVSAATETLKRLSVDFPRVTSDGIRHAREVSARAVDDLSRFKTPGDLQRAPQVATPLAELADEALADALTGWAYALAIGDSDSPVLLSDSVIKRHDFGIGSVERGARSHSEWDVPRQLIAPGVPWRVSGSLIGLDVALAPLVLRRIDGNRVVDAPTLSTNEREAFAVSAALLNPWLLRDRDRDAIAEAVAAGRQRVALLAEDAGGLAGIASDIRMDGWRRRALLWTIAHDPQRIGSLFSMTELLQLGRAAPSDFDVWGTSALISSGCFCTRLAPPHAWRALIGRPQVGLMASVVPDLNLHIAVMLHDLQLPAAIAKAVLTAATQDMIDDVRPTDANDWLSLIRAARTASRERVEDYVSAVTADGPLVPASDTAPPHRP